MLVQRLTRNLFTGQDEPLTAPLTRDFTEDLGDGRAETFFNKFGGAAAAYSLRALGSYNENVVRVRRESDNSEKDFTAVDVAGGEMARWVNEQPTLPLDLRELDKNTGERDGDLIEAAAAYSLRNLKALGTKVTINDSSDVRDGKTGTYVVQVRRSSDDTVKSFTASEVANGTLEDWVNADLDITNRLIVPSDIATRFVVTSSTDASNYNASIDNDSASTDFVQIRSGLFGEGRYRLRGTLEVSDLVGNLSIQTNGGVASGTQNVGLSNGTNNLDFEFDITGDGSTTSAGSTLLYFLIPSGTSATLGVSNLTWEVTQANGHVKTWYDQSGSDNHATQTDTAKQPKIVENGSLLKDSRDNPAIDFDDVDDNMDLTSDLVASGAYSAIAYHEFAGPSMILKGNLNVPRIRLTSSTNYQIGSYSPEVNQDFTVASTLGLVSVLKDASHNARVYANGTESSSGQQNVGSGSVPFTMLGTEISDGAANGKLVEVIYYESDQSNNRTAIEANIGETYGITAIPAANDTVNGYVQTWYDQSGNGYDAREPSSQYQPLIVENGSIVTDTDGKVAIKGTGSTLRLGHFPWDGESPREMLSADGTHSLFIVCDLPDQTTGNATYNYISRFLSTSTPPANKRPRVFLRKTTGELSLAAEADPSKVKVSSSDAQSAQLVTDIVNPSGTTKAEKHSVYIDGAFNAEQPYGTTWIPDGNKTLSNDSRLFSRGETTVDTYISELIYYPSDQSASRPAIETNIANQYGITPS